ncbi:MAG: transporter substrate-binding domain-containing protein [Psychromonas sp.]|nr:transporter substrate-binding domain-containing protein [Psychromonas sp.]
MLPVAKRPTARCDDKDKYKRIRQIDMPNVKVKVKVKVIVNLRGTNQKLINKYIKFAHIIAYNDNNKIFDKINEGKADVMITDSIEVKLQSKLNPTLCPTMQGKTFDKYEKYYLMHRDSIWKDYVNA